MTGGHSSFALVKQSQVCMHGHWLTSGLSFWRKYRCLGLGLGFFSSLSLRLIVLDPVVDYEHSHQ
jgi:hypothetical protein